MSTNCLCGNQHFQVFNSVGISKFYEISRKYFVSKLFRDPIKWIRLSPSVGPPTNENTPTYKPLNVILSDCFGLEISNQSLGKAFRMYIVLIDQTLVQFCWTVDIGVSSFYGRSLPKPKQNFSSSYCLKTNECSFYNRECSLS